MSDQPLSEIYKIAGDTWVDLDATARLLEETKSLRFAQHCASLGDIAVNKAEQTIKAAPFWMDEVVKGVDARTAANKARVYMESVKMRHSEWQSEEANHRAEARL